jgi:hypothetical protein
MSTGTVLPGGSPGVNEISDPYVALVECDVEVVVAAARVGPSQRQLELQAKTLSGELRSESYRLDRDPGRVLRLFDALGLDASAQLIVDDLVGRHMVLDVDVHGAWCCERPATVSTVPTTLAITLQDVRDAYKRYLLIDDVGVIDAPLAARIAHDFKDTEAIALVVVGPSSSVKTEVVSPLGKATKGHALSDLSSKTLVSGWHGTAGNASLLNKLKDNVLVVKDLTTILSGRADERAKVLGQLREILDGSYQQAWGNSESIDWTGKVSVVAACTPVIDAHYAAIAQLGTRFVYIRTAIDDPNAIAVKAMVDGAASKQARAKAAQVVVDFIAQFRPVDLKAIGLSEVHRDELARWATFLATARTPVIRDPYGREIVEVPVVEGPARAVKQLHQLAAARARLDSRTTVEAADIALVRRIAWDSIPLLRARVLASVLRLHTAVITAVAEDVQRLGTTMIRRCLDDLYALGLLNREDYGESYRYVPSAALDGIEPVVPTVPEKSSKGDK